MQAKQKAADILGNTKYFYFIDKYGLQWEFEQGHTDIGD
jgi:maltose O-acetyltransferase